MFSPQKLFFVLILLSILSSYPHVEGRRVDFPSNFQAMVQAYLKTNFVDLDCLTNCTTPSSSWGATPFLCTRQGNFANNLCGTGSSFSNCVASAAVKGDPTDWTILNPGTCACPSDCSGHGTCDESKGCLCDEGYQGVDCASIDCASKQTCSNRGVCEKSLFPGTDLEISSCVCEDGYVLNDCSGTMTTLPAIPSLLGDPQYSDWDEYDDNHPIFNESTIAQIHLQISQEDLDFLINPVNQDIREYKHANFSFYNGAVTEVMEDVGMRIKGGLSRTFAKKSWKISFNTFVKGREWAQQKKIALKDASMDSMYVREKSAMAAVYAMGGPTPRGSHTMVYINGMAWGLYVILEDPGRDEFLKSRFGTSKGSLWKCVGTLEYLGSDPDLYRTEEYKASNDNAEESYEPLENFISVLNLTPDDEFEEKIQTVMNVEFFLRTLVAEVATGNGDGIWNGNNYFLYYQTDGLMYYYRHDLDLSFGFVDVYQRMAIRSVWEWGSATPPGRGRLLIDRILSVPSFQEMYSSYLLKLMTYVNVDQSGSYARRVSGIHSSIQAAVALDAWHSLDMVMPSQEDFEKNLQEDIYRPAFWPPIQGVPISKWSPFPGLFPFIKERNDFTETQLQSGPPSRK